MFCVCMYSYGSRAKESSLVAIPYHVHVFHCILQHGGYSAQCHFTPQGDVSSAI